jgi:hypothetical protein
VVLSSPKMKKARVMRGLFTIIMDFLKKGLVVSLLTDKVINFGG